MSDVGPTGREDPPPVSRRAARWHELDLLRGLAAFLMVLNHVAVKSPGVWTSRAISAAEMAGGLAPVFFYFVTGLGYGVQSASNSGKGGRQGYGFLLKVAVLLAADSDFFTFIGLSMLVLEVLRRLPRGGTIAAALAAGSVALRYAAGPLLRPVLAGRAWGEWAGDVLGTSGHFGYPVGPWLAYPMLGYVLGGLAASRREAVDAFGRLPAGLAAVAVPFAVGSAALVARGNALLRYGGMNAAYFLASLAALSLGLAAARLLARSPRLSAAVPWLSLTGLRSFAVVPLHYFLLEVAAEVMGGPVDGPTFARNFVPVFAASVLGSAAFVRLAARLDRPSLRGPVWAAVVAITAAYYLFWRGSVPGLAGTALRSLVQVALCLLLSFRNGPGVPPPAKAPAGSR